MVTWLELRLVFLSEREMRKGARSLSPLNENVKLISFHVLMETASRVEVIGEKTNDGGQMSNLASQPRSWTTLALAYIRTRVIRVELRIDQKSKA